MAFFDESFSNENPILVHADDDQDDGELHLVNFSVIGCHDVEVCMQ